MAAVLRAHGVRFVFTLVGGHISPLLVACEKLGIRVVDTRHEVTAVFAADAVARLTGKSLGGWQDSDVGPVSERQRAGDRTVVESVGGMVVISYVFQGQWAWQQ